MEHVAKIFHKQHEVDLLADLRSRNRLWSAVEKAKRELSELICDTCIRTMPRSTNLPGHLPEALYMRRGRKIRAVLVTPEGFERRFLDVKAREDKKRFLETVRLLRRH